MPRWRHSIDIKRLFKDQASANEIKEICDVLTPQLRKIHRSDEEILDPDLMNRFENLIIEFESISEAIKLGQSAYNGCWIEEFDEWLDELYDIADEVTCYNEYFDREKFMWVG